MDQAFWTAERVTGALLVGPILMALVALAIMMVSGTIAGFRPAIEGDLERMAPFAGALDFQILLFIISWVVHLLGIGLLAQLLARAGAEQLAVLAFTLILVTVFSAILKFSFDMAVELWVAQEVAQTGNPPALFEPLSTWTSRVFRLGYAIHFLAMIGVGWAILRSGLHSASLGWATIGWSSLWLVGALFGAGAPAVPLLMPAAIGVALLLK